MSAIELSPELRGQRGPTMGTLVRRYLRPHITGLTMLGAFLLATTLLRLVAPLIIRSFIDLARGGADGGTLTRTAVLYLLAVVAAQVIAVADAVVASGIAWRATNRLRNDLFLHCLRLDLPFHHSNSPGVMVERIDGDVETLQNLFSHFVVRLAGNVLLLLGVLTVMLAVDWRLGIYTILFTVVVLLVLRAVRNISVSPWGRQRETSAEMVGYLEEALTSTEDIRANGAEIHAIRSFQGRSREMRSATVRALLGVGLIAGLTTAMFQPGIAGALGVATILLEHHQLTLGTVFLVFNYALLLTQPLEELGRQLQDLQSAGAGATRVAELLATRSTLPEAPAADRLGEGGPLALVFDRVTFAYGDGEPALRHITFELPAGESLGVIGRTGSGKTTLARLALRLYDPSVGAVVVGGRDVRTIPTAELRARVALVPQEVQLLHATVRNNITLFDHSITDERVRQALEDLNIGRVGNRGEGGLNEVLAAGGVDLSGGEAQLLALARAFLLNPGLVVLDEASSRVDPATEQALEGAMDRLLAGRTAVVIAHRLSTLQRVDRILVLEEGRVVEVGRRAELAADPGSHLARLLRGDLSEALL